MFDRTINETKVCPVTRIVEQSITPDKVTEMYDKIKNQIDSDTVNRLLVKSDVFTGIVSESIDSATRTREIKTAFKMNEQLYERKYLVTEEETHLEPELLIRKLQEHYVDEVTRVLLKTMFTHVDVFNKWKH